MTILQRSESNIKDLGAALPDEFKIVPPIRFDMLGSDHFFMFQ
jgi:hypothetical protein